MLKDQEQVRQISSEVGMAKLKDVILEKATKKETKISHDEFLEELDAAEKGWEKKGGLTIGEMRKKYKLSK